MADDEGIWAKKQRRKVNESPGEKDKKTTAIIFNLLKSRDHSETIFLFFKWFLRAVIVYLQAFC